MGALARAGRTIAPSQVFSFLTAVNGNEGSLRPSCRP